MLNSAPGIAFCNNPNPKTSDPTCVPGVCGPFIVTSHASIAYREQLPPQRTAGTIGSVWQESTPPKETL